MGRRREREERASTNATFYNNLKTIVKKKSHQQYHTRATIHLTVKRYEFIPKMLLFKTSL